MKHFIFHIVGVLGFLLSTAAAQDLEQVVRQSEGAVLIVTGNDALSGAPIQGSGSCVHTDGYVLAAAHQIIGLANIKGKLKNGDVFDPTPVETLPELDFALLKSDRPMPQAVRLGDARTLATGADLFAITTPVQLEFTLSTGIVAHPLRTFQNHPVVQANLPVSAGSSGGAVFDRDGFLIGLVHGASTRGFEFTLVLPINNAYPLLRRHHIPVPLSPLPIEGESEIIPVEGITQTELRAVEAYNRGVDAFDPEEKADAYDLAVQLLPKFYEAQFNLAVALAAANQPKAAAAAYVKAAEIRPDAPEAYRNLGLLHLRFGDVEAAAQAFKAAAAAAPREARSYSELGEAYRRLKRYSDAAAQFEIALAIKPDYAVAHFNLALANNAQGDTDGAIEHFEHYLRLSPQATDRAQVLGWIKALRKPQ